MDHDEETRERMANSISLARRRKQMLERRHKDQPVLWISVVFASVGIHVLLWWLWLMWERQGNMLVEQVDIPVEVVAVSPFDTQPQESVQGKTPAQPKEEKITESVAGASESKQTQQPQVEQKKVKKPADFLQPNPIKEKPIDLIEPTPEAPRQRRRKKPSDFLQPPAIAPEQVARNSNETNAAPSSSRPTSTDSQRATKKPADFLQPPAISSDQVIARDVPNIRPQPSSSGQRVARSRNAANLRQPPAIAPEQVARNRNETSAAPSFSRPTSTDSQRATKKPADFLQPPAISGDQVIASNSSDVRVYQPGSRESAQTRNRANNSSATAPSTQQGNPQTAPNRQVGGNFSASINGLKRTGGDFPDREAQPRRSVQQFSAVDYLPSLDITLEEDVVVQVAVVVDNQGQPRVDLSGQSAQVLQGNLPAGVAGQLAKKIVDGWEFEPAYMEGSPVWQSYLLILRISPN